jgi:hypothetical protein
MIPRSCRWCSAEAIWRTIGLACASDSRDSCWHRMKPRSSPPATYSVTRQYTPRCFKVSYSLTTLGCWIFLSMYASRRMFLLTYSSLIFRVSITFTATCEAKHEKGVFLFRSGRIAIRLTNIHTISNNTHNGLWLTLCWHNFRLANSLTKYLTYLWFRYAVDC